MYGKELCKCDEVDCSVCSFNNGRGSCRPNRNKWLNQRGLTLIEYKEYVNGEDDGEGYYFDFKPKYCPNCGRKIVD